MAYKERAASVPVTMEQVMYIAKTANQTKTIRDIAFDLDINITMVAYIVSRLRKGGLPIPRAKGQTGEMIRKVIALLKDPKALAASGIETDPTKMKLFKRQPRIPKGRTND